MACCVWCYLLPLADAVDVIDGSAAGNSHWAVLSCKSTFIYVHKLHQYMLSTWLLLRWLGFTCLRCVPCQVPWFTCCGYNSCVLIASSQNSQLVNLLQQLMQRSLKARLTVAFCVWPDVAICRLDRLAWHTWI